jgi:hypothetical protein
MVLITTDKPLSFVFRIVNRKTRQIKKREGKKSNGCSQSYWKP